LKINFDDSYEPGGEDNISKGQAIEAVMDALRLVIEQHQPRRKAA
jgi:hypothetical protein